VLSSFDTPDKFELDGKSNKKRATARAMVLPKSPSAAPVFRHAAQGQKPPVPTFSPNLTRRH
jgi:hypothetical protein